ncbi:hypothetical protein ADE_18610 [Achromobacter denitrificans]|nr:hypothetical protein ADE_18610 [Achromobacter denitrificans]
MRKRAGIPGGAKARPIRRRRASDGAGRADRYRLPAMADRAALLTFLSPAHEIVLPELAT